MLEFSQTYRLLGLLLYWSLLLIFPVMPGECDCLGRCQPRENKAMRDCSTSCRHSHTKNQVKFWKAASSSQDGLSQPWDWPRMWGESSDQLTAHTWEMHPRDGIFSCVNINNQTSFIKVCLYEWLQRMNATLCLTITSYILISFCLNKA